VGAIWKGLRDAVSANGGTATLSENGAFETRPDVAVVVFGEAPYAEFAGDQRDLILRDTEGLELLRLFRQQDIPTVAIFLSGRPLWMNRELNVANAFIASWLPGSEGGGIADVLTGVRPATGQLSFSWPDDCAGEPVNGPEGALFAYGYGRSLDDTSALPELSEECAALVEFDSSELFASGRLTPGVVAYADDGEVLAQLRGQSRDGRVSVRGYDRNAQEDAREIAMMAGSGFAFVQENGSHDAYRITYEVVTRPDAPVSLLVGDRGAETSVIDVTPHFAHAFDKGWRQMVITEDCAPGLGREIQFSTEGDIIFRIASVRRENLPEGTECSF
jgi:beta-glucosidase